MKSKKLKQLISTVMIATTIATTVPTTINTTVAFASEMTYATEDDAIAAGFIFALSGNEYQITGYTGEGGNVVIPSQINNKPVTSIGQEAFEGMDINRIPTNSFRINSITIPNSIKSIGVAAFAHCINLTSISIPNSVTSIGHAAFADCGNLRSIEVPDSVTNIGPYAFAEISPYAIFYVASQSEAQLLWTSSRMNYGMRIIILDLMERTKSDTTVTLDFPALRGASSVKIQQSADGETWTDAATEALTEYSTTATVTGLIPNTSYKFRLLLNGDFPGSESDTITTLKTSPTLTADSTSNDAENPIDITFADNIGWRQAITEVDVDGSRIDSQNYVISEGKIRFNPGVLSAESHYIKVFATNYTDATVSQEVNLGTAPTAGESGIITANNATPNSVDLSWAAGSDNVTVPANLKYKIVYSTSNNIDTVENAEENGTVAEDWSANLTNKQVTGLNASTQYYFNVIVKDEAGNERVYSMATQSTIAEPDTTAPTAGESGIITASNATPNSVDLSWAAGSDNVTVPANLKYKIVYSTSNNIDTVENAEENGTVAEDWSGNLTNKQVTGLNASTQYYFNVIVKDEAGNERVYSMATQSTIAEPDTTLPTAGESGIITASNATPNSVDLSWAAGSDNVTAPANLKYKIVYSTSNNIDTVENAEENGTVAEDWSANLTNKQVTGLNASTQYYFNVIVKDETGNESVYSMATQSTIAEPDTTLPTAGGSGTITASNATPNSVDLSWAAGSDNVTAPANLKYKIVYSTSNNIDTVENAEENGTVAEDWSGNLTNKQVTGLNASTQYYFNVIVKDEAGNMSVYNTATQATIAAPAINGVSVTAATSSVKQGDTDQMTATVDTVGGANETVTWSSNDASGKVTVDPTTGLVTIASDAQPGEYTITATSTVDPSKKGTVTITVTEDEHDEISVTGVNSINAITVDNGTAISDLNLPDTIDVNLSNSTTTSAAVTWDNGNPEYDGDTEGTYVFTGTLTLPEGVTNPSDLKAIMSVNVKAAENETPPSAVTVESIESLDNITVDNGTEIGDIELPDTIDVNLSNSTTTSAAVTWNNGTPKYDGNKAGTYLFTGILRLLDGITNPSNLKASVVVNVKPAKNQTTPAAVTVESVESLDNITVNNGTARKDIKLPDTVRVTLSDSTTTSANIRWEDVNPIYNGYRAGTYVFTGKLILPEGVTNPYDYSTKVNVIVKAASSSSSSSSSSHNNSKASNSKEQVTVNITDGSSDKSVSKTLIERIKASDGSKIDAVKYTDDKAKETIAALAKEGKDTARIVATDSDASVSQTQISIPKDTLSELSSGKVNLEIQVNGAIVSVPKESVQSLAQSGQLNGDLYFRVVPIKDETKQEAIKTTADKEATVKAAAGNNGVQVLGTPMTIETNMGQRPVDIILPLTEINLPTDPAQRQAFLNDLGVFIEHSDGEKVLEKGTIVDYGNGVLGLKFRTNKFSDFTIVKLNQSAKSGWKLTNGSWYFINNNGAMETGWHKANSGEWTYDGKDTVDTWFHLGSDGKMDTGWFKDTDGSWYFLCNGTNYGALGVMETGWKYLDGKWYFLKDNGVMATGWQKSNGKWYYLYSDGSMASDTVVDGYTVGSDGAWIQQ